MATKTQLMKVEPISPLLPSPDTRHTALFVGTPVCYHVSHQTQICRRCCSYHETSQTNLELIGARFKIFRKVTTFEYNLPLHIHHEPPEYLLACRNCAASIDLSHLPPPERPVESDVKSKWRTLTILPTTEKKKITSMDL